MVWRIGVDSGGTFTDVCLFDEHTGRVEVWKLSSTPNDPSRGIADIVQGRYQFAVNGGGGESATPTSSRPSSDQGRRRIAARSVSTKPRSMRH